MRRAIRGILGRAVVDSGAARPRPASRGIWSYELSAERAGAPSISDRTATWCSTRCARVSSWTPSPFSSPPPLNAARNSTGGVNELEDAYKDCVPAVRKALKNLATGICWPMYDRDPIENWVAGGMVLMGDAAHPMLQYLAQGACQAPEDAAVLQDASLGHGLHRRRHQPQRVEGAIKEFNTIRAGGTARIQRTAGVWGESWHVSGLARTLHTICSSRAGRTTTSSTTTGCTATTATACHPSVRPSPALRSGFPPNLRCRCHSARRITRNVLRTGALLGSRPEHIPNVHTSGPGGRRGQNQE
jgi:2-polyprenyl-6-methoxyphenol hydroxylase-like FAD-dependent oxidoreductase